MYQINMVWRRNSGDAAELHVTVDKSRRIRVAVLVAALAGSAGFYWFRGDIGGPEPGRAATGRAPVPVTAMVASRQDLPIYLTGLGTVQATLTVGIHSQVDGKLQEVRFTEGQRVKKGDILAKIDPRLFKAALDQAKAKRAQDEAMRGAAEKDLTRFKALALKSFETQQNVDAQQAKVDQLGALLDADAAAIESAQTQLDYTDIVAPSDGRVGVRLVDPGNTVRAADAGAIVNLVLAQPAAVLFTLPAHMLDDVRQAMSRGTIEVTAFDQNNQASLSTGTLLMVDNAIDQASATIRLKAIFANEDERLWPGEFVNARLLLETRSNVVAVPAAAIQRGPRGLFAWVATANDTAAVRPIQLGPTTGDLTIVTSGLNDGDRVVTEGQYKLQANVPVTVSAPSATAVGSTM
jgi:multidrug efflux system membrane fusion protein